MTAASETARLRRCRELFERAASANVTLQEARRQEARDRWAALDARLAQRRADRDGQAEQLAWWQR